MEIQPTNAERYFVGELKERVDDPHIGLKLAVRYLVPLDFAKRAVGGLCRKIGTTSFDDSGGELCPETKRADNPTKADIAQFRATLVHVDIVE